MPLKKATFDIFVRQISPIQRVIFILLFIIYLFWLPTFSFWTFYPPHSDLSTLVKTGISTYQHPPIPVVKPSSIPPVQAQAFAIVDVNTNQVISSKNLHQRIYPASVTKLATALTALNVYPLNEVVTINQEYKDGKVMELEIGEKITIKSLVSALLIYSANDAAYNLASHYSGGIPAFISEMNYLASKYGLAETHFINFDGIHDPNHYSSVYDLSQLGRLAIKNSILRQVVKTPFQTVTDVTGQISHPLITTNELLGNVPEIEGLKTGWTPEAGGCFVGLINLNDHELITVVAQSPDRFLDTKNLISWAKQNITWGSYSP